MHPTSHIYYFAYGSNLNPHRISNRIDKVINCGRYVLKNYKLEFNCGHFTNSYANIVPKIGEEVEGVLYKLTDKEIAKLDQYEVYPYNYEKIYWVDDGKIIFAYISTSLIFRSIAKPSIEYLNVIIDGCKHNNLIATYNRLVDYKLKKYKLKKCKHKFIYERI